MAGVGTVAGNNDALAQVCWLLTATRATDVPTMVIQAIKDYRIAAPNIEVTAVPEYLKKDCILFYYPDTEPLAKRIVEVSNGSVELGEIVWSYVAHCGQRCRGNLDV